MFKPITLYFSDGEEKSKDSPPKLWPGDAKGG